MKRPFARVVIVLGGYLLALLAGYTAVALNEGRLSALPQPASDGMAAFGDLVLFILVFGALAVLPTAGALYFILKGKKRPNQLL